MLNSEVKTRVAIDRKKICPVITEDATHYVCSGVITPFRISKERCQEIDDEFLVILNIHGYDKAKEYAKAQGYIE